jgi:3',5'-cyclic-AMP phosphodiesterase
VNVASEGTDKGLGILGVDQLDWLKADVAGLADSTPIVVIGHVPFWSVHPQWGWGIQDGLQALGHLKRFGSVTVLNGHIHQALQKVEGKDDVSHRSLDRLPPAGPRTCAGSRTVEGRGARQAPGVAGTDERDLS